VPRGAPNFAPKNIRRYLPADRFIQRGPTGAPNVSITIDDFFGRDGADYLGGLLDVGKYFNVPFTLFPTGYALDTHDRLGYRDLWRRAADEGHVIGNHTYHHYIRPDRPYKYFAGLRPGEIHDELEFTRQSLHQVLGYDYATYLMRPPGGSGGYPSNHKDHAYALGQVAQEGYYMTMWTTDSNAPDGRIVTKNQDERFLDKVFTDKNESARNGSIILLHPTTLSINGVKKLISGLHDRGFDCRTVPGMFM
jgi:peptidoglycan/xylan/chitin deacetylase (PgdA/CDA1 family)